MILLLFDCEKLHLITADEKELLDANHITNAQELYQCISSGTPGFNGYNFHQILSIVHDTLSKMEHQVILSPIFNIDGYQNHPYKDILVETDKLVMGRELLVFSINNPSCSYRQDLAKFSIDTLKYLASHINVYGENALITNLYGIGNTRLRKLVDAIDFYEKQILRVACDISTLTTSEENLFLKDREQKLEIINQEYKNIVQYLFSNGKVFIFGSLSCPYDLLSAYSIQEPRTINEYWKTRVRDRFINTICNYTTLHELEDGVIENHTLDRFILQRKR